MRIARNLFFVLLISTALSACSLVEDKTKGNRAPPPGATSAQEKLPPTAMDTFRALAPSEGMKFTPLFAVPLSDENERFARLEQAVQSLRNDFDTVTPAITRLVAIEKDIKDLVGDLQTLTGKKPAPSPYQPPQRQSNRIPGEDIVGGTNPGAEAAGAAMNSSLVTPEAALTGELPPDGAASPYSQGPYGSLQAQVPPPEPQMARQIEAPLDLTAAPQETLSEQDKVQAPAQAQVQPVAVAPVPVAQPKPAPVAPSAQKQGALKNVRIGDHADKTRIVLDLTAKVPYTARLENNGKRLVVDISALDWAASQTEWDAMTAVLVAGWRYENGMLVADLLYPATIKMQNILPPNGSPYQRLVIDLYAAQVHKG